MVAEAGLKVRALENRPDLQMGLTDYLYASVSARTWGKYGSGWRAFEVFEKEVKQSFSWPLEKDTIRGFTAYCLKERKLQPSSVRAYLSSIVMLHKIKGFVDYEISDKMVNMILKGASNLSLTYGSAPANRRRVMTLPLLRHFGHKLGVSGWHELTKQCFWAAGLVAFFGTVRMGELLSPFENSLDPSTTLTWGDILFREESDSLLLHLKIPKNAPREGEFVDIFKFGKYGCCPVAAVKRLRQLQVERGRGGAGCSPFIFPSGLMMTQAVFNKSLQSLLVEVCGTGENSISGHSFRAGIPSEMTRHPELMSSDEIKGWGRWSSEAYNCYTRLHLDQKKKIFQKITDVLEG